MTKICDICDKPMDDSDNCCMCAEEREESIESNYPIEGYDGDQEE